MANKVNYFEKGKELFKKEKYALAKSAWEKALIIEPTNIKILNNLGAACRFLGEFKQAEVYLTKAIKIEGSFGMAYRNLGELYLESGEYDKAQEALIMANAIFPDNEAVLCQLITSAKHNCDWLLTKSKETTLQVLMSESLERGEFSGVTPYFVNTSTDNPKLKLLVAQNWAKEIK